MRNRPWVEKFETGEYLRKWNGYEPHILGCTIYSEHIGIGEDKRLIPSFNEHQENLNICDASNSLFFRYWDKQPLVYLSVDENGDEQMSDDKPVRQDVRGKGYWYSDTIRKCPNGFIEKLTGLSISWSDEPLQYMIKDKRTITDEEDKMLKKMARDLRKSNDY